MGKIVKSLGLLPMLLLMGGVAALAAGLLAPVQFPANSATADDEGDFAAVTAASTLARGPYEIDLTSRPVFHQSRKLHVATAPPPAEAPPALPLRQVSLTGVFSGGDGYTASLYDVAADKQIFVRQDDELDGFVVTSIDRETVVFAREGERRVITLHAGRR